MPSILNRYLTTLLFLFGSISLANAQSGVMPQSAGNPGTPGWSFVQDSPVIFCVGPASGCNISIGNIVPTVAGSVWILQVQTTNNVTMSSVTGGGGTWIHCPKCIVRNPSGFSSDAWYNLTGTAGTQQGVNFTLSGNSGAVMGVNFVELLPPAGTTASYDDSGTAAPTGCVTCTAVGGLNITGTDAIWQNPGGSGQQDFNSWSAPYITTANGSGLALNTTSGAAPTSTYRGVANPEFVALAFKSTAGVFTPPTPQYSIVNYTAPDTVKNGTTMSCGPGGCNLTIPSTGAGNLLYLEGSDAANSRITSVSGGGNWVIPAACYGNATLLGMNMAQSCAYVLSSTVGATSLHITMSGTAQTAFAAIEIASTSGTFVLDAIGGHVNTTAGVFYPPGQALTLTGANDVVIQALTCVGGSGGPNYYPRPYNQTSFNYYSFNLAAIAVLTDSGPTAPTPIWTNPQANNPQPGVIASGMAFKAVGGSTPPNPPTGLGVVVQ